MEKIIREVESEIKKRGISEEEISEILSNQKSITNRRIIYGYASCAVVDREGQKIPIPALKEAVDRFMKNIYLRNLNVFHSDVSIGRILPMWTNPKTGKMVKTEVDDKGWLVVCEVRTDIDMANKVWDEIIKGNIRSFSIAGSSKDKLQKYENGQRYEQINSLDVVEITACQQGVNQLARFEVLYNPTETSI